jgi:hypothetical protein
VKLVERRVQFSMALRVQGIAHPGSINGNGHHPFVRDNLNRKFISHGSILYLRQAA